MLNPSDMSLLWGLPFVGVILSIALFPLMAEDVWHAHFGKITVGWSLGFLLPFFVVYGLHLAWSLFLHTLFFEYIPFVALLLALFTVSGGVTLEGSLRGTPLVNTLLLLVGVSIASFTGTTGAAMLLIRPLLRANDWRTHPQHVVIFFIFLVANIGGSLTPLGDPPLFLGFLKGVPFFWPMKHLLFPMLVSVALVLGAFYVLDSIYYRREGPLPPKEGEKLRIRGGLNLVLLGAVVASVLMSGLWKPGITLPWIHLALQDALRDLFLVLITWISWKRTPKELRIINGFSWFPMIEVAKLFAGIFTTIIPVIVILKAGEQGHLRAVTQLVTRGGEPFNAMYFWVTGVLSSFLDNAPTYLVFFNTAGGDPALLTGPLNHTLVAISSGAVFFGANTYIGNAPNFMVRSIAVERGVSMPSFFGYMKWSTIFLIPTFALITLLFF